MSSNVYLLTATNDVMSSLSPGVEEEEEEEEEEEANSSIKVTACMHHTAHTYSDLH